MESFKKNEGLYCITISSTTWSPYSLKVRLQTVVVSNCSFLYSESRILKICIKW